MAWTGCLENCITVSTVYDFVSWKGMVTPAGYEIINCYNMEYGVFCISLGNEM